MSAPEPQVIEAVVARIHGFHEGHGNLAQLVEDLRMFAVNYRSRESDSTIEFRAAWTNLATLAESPDIPADGARQRLIDTSLEAIVRVIRRL